MARQRQRRQIARGMTGCVVHAFARWPMCSRAAHERLASCALYLLCAGVLYSLTLLPMVTSLGTSFFPSVVFFLLSLLCLLSLYFLSVLYCGWAGRLDLNVQRVGAPWRGHSGGGCLAACVRAFCFVVNYFVPIGHQASNSHRTPWYTW